MADSASTVWVIWDRADPYQGDDIPCGYFSSQDAAKTALEAYWNAHEPAYFSGRERFDAGHYITEERVLESGDGWEPFKSEEAQDG